MIRRFGRALSQHLQTPFVVVTLVLMVYVLWRSQHFVMGAGLFPQVVAGMGIFIAVLELVRQWRRRGARESNDFSDLGSEDDSPAFALRGLLFFAWLALFMVLMLLIGPVPAAGLYCLLILMVQFSTPWRIALPVALFLMVLVYFLGWALRLRWPDPILF